MDRVIDCFYCYTTCIAPSDAVRARPKEVDFQVSYNVISPNPMTKTHGTFNNRSLSVGMQQKATEIAHIVL